MAEKFDLIKHHIMSSAQAAMAEADGFEEEAARLRAQGNLRLMLMSENELWELAELLSFPPLRSAEDVYAEIKLAIAENESTADQWVGSLSIDPSGVMSGN